MKKRIVLIIALIASCLGNAQQYYQIEGSNKIFASKDSIQPHLEATKERYNKTSVEKYGYIATNVSYDIKNTIKRNDSVITFVKLLMDMKKVSYSSEKVFKLKDKLFTFPSITSKEEIASSTANKYLGKPTLLNLWFTNCTPCIKEIPELNKIKKQFKSKVNFVAITFEKEEEVQEFLTKIPFEFEMILNQKKYLKEILEVQSYPKLILVDKNGKVLFVSNGLKLDNEYRSQLKLSKESLIERLRKLL